MLPSGEVNLETILKVLPHRYPFMLVDRVLSLDAPVNGSIIGRKGVAIKNVTYNEPFFNGHFPEKQIMPGVLIIEAMAQVAGIVAHNPPTPDTVMEVALVSINNARFRKPVIPGDQLKITSQLLKQKGIMFSFYCEAHVDNQLVAEAEILAASYPKKEVKK